MFICNKIILCIIIFLNIISIGLTDIKPFSDTEIYLFEKYFSKEDIVKFKELEKNMYNLKIYYYDKIGDVIDSPEKMELQKIFSEKNKKLLNNEIKYFNDIVSNIGIETTNKWKKWSENYLSIVNDRNQPNHLKEQIRQENIKESKKFNLIHNELSLLDKKIFYRTSGYVGGKIIYPEIINGKHVFRDEEFEEKWKDVPRPSEWKKDAPLKYIKYRFHSYKSFMPLYLIKYLIEIILVYIIPHPIILLLFIRRKKDYKKIYLKTFIKLFKISLFFIFIEIMFIITGEIIVPEQYYSRVHYFINYPFSRIVLLIGTIVLFKNFRKYSVKIEKVK